MVLRVHQNKFLYFDMCYQEVNRVIHFTDTDAYLARYFFVIPIYFYFLFFWFFHLFFLNYHFSCLCLLLTIICVLFAALRFNMEMQ